MRVCSSEADAALQKRLNLRVTADSDACDPFTALLDFVSHAQIVFTVGQTTCVADEESRLCLTDQSVRIDREGKEKAEKYEWGQSNG